MAASPSHVIHDRKKAAEACITPECWQEAKCCGMCNACYGSWRRLRDLSGGEYKTHVKRVKRFYSRIAIVPQLKRTYHPRPSHLKQVK
jgi:hypothetical protein